MLYIQFKLFILKRIQVILIYLVNTTLVKVIVSDEFEKQLEDASNLLRIIQSSMTSHVAEVQCIVEVNYMCLKSL